MDLNETAVFVRVVQAGSFSAAARQLGLPTSTVSTRVARLERRLGVTLLQRTTRRLHLTDLGELYFRHAEAGLANLLDAEAALTESVGEPKGRLRVTAPTTGLTVQNMLMTPGGFTNNSSAQGQPQ